MYRSLPLRAHDLLHDAALHDVWSVHLRRAGPETTAREVMASLLDLEAGRVNPAVRALFALRTGLGRAFGWDEPAPELADASYVIRLGEEDRARSADAPGTTLGPVTLLYTFDRDAVAEVVNRTVHAFLVFALERSGDGVWLQWAIHVKPVGRLTPLYMAAIDPFRRWVVYPALLGRLEDAWSDETAGGSAAT